MTDQVKQKKVAKPKKVKCEEPAQCEEKAVVESFVQTNEDKPKKKATRKKNGPTRDEQITYFNENIEGAKKLCQELKDDQVKFLASGLDLPSIKHLIEDELLNLDEERAAFEKLLKKLMDEPCEV